MKNSTAIYLGMFLKRQGHVIIRINASGIQFGLAAGGNRILPEFKQQKQMSRFLQKNHIRT